MKRIITMVLVMIMVVVIGTCTVTAKTVCQPVEVTEPEIIGMEHYDALMEVDNRMKNGDYEVPYEVAMRPADGYWMVAIKGVAAEFDGYWAVGFYDHIPTEAEIEVLWANRMPNEMMINKLSLH